VLAADPCPREAHERLMLELLQVVPEPERRLLLLKY
jgi:hypothetical protein